MDAGEEDLEDLFSGDSSEPVRLTKLPHVIRSSKPQPHDAGGVPENGQTITSKARRPFHRSLARFVQRTRQGRASTS